MVVEITVYNLNTKGSVKKYYWVILKFRWGKIMQEVTDDKKRGKLAELI